ncbi:mitochondrial chaperone BCS1-like [Daphnia carinata]|uniref:mitochondrial chaperone BCS1-like n=1 Tax=Daphnia carinata TaxID=120202 RepID=UPI00257DBEC8|nr:mitochondrial chaperone BCS1-like [Daphnia carinata]
MTIADYISSLTSNPYFGAGFGLFGVGAGAALLRKGWQGTLILFRRHYIMTLEVPCRDKSYQWMLQWITTRGAVQTQHLSVATEFSQSESGKVSTSYHFIPSVGVHLFKYKNNWIRVERTREQHTLDLHMGVPWETVTLTALGKNKKMFTDMLEEARLVALKQTEGRTILYTALGSEWRQFGAPRKRRPLESVVLDVGVAERIVQDLVDFIGNPQWYSQRGVPYRRGYLLHGPPGCGKSSFITALAGKLECVVCVLNLSEKGLTDDRLNHLMNTAPVQSIILLEDIDAAFVSRDESKSVKSAYDGANRVTLSGLLNCLDGVTSTEARVLFMTTNYLDRLDPALIRPGRVDVQEFIGYCSEFQLANMFRKFYPEAHELLVERFVQAAKSLDKNLSPASVQGHFMFHKTSPEDAIVNLHKLR